MNCIRFAIGVKKPAIANGLMNDYWLRFIDNHYIRSCHDS